MAEYQLLPKDPVLTMESVIRVADGAIIPFDPDNRHYQEYLAWLDEGNEPDPPPPPTAVTLPETAPVEDRVAALEDRVDALESDNG
jgi:hypothetical protein